MVIIFAIGLWLIGERLCAFAMRFALAHGARLALLPSVLSAVFLGISGAFVFVILGLCAIGLWAFANRWPFSAMAKDFGLRFWQTERHLVQAYDCDCLGGKLSLPLSLPFGRVLDALKWHAK